MSTIRLVPLTPDLERAVAANDRDPLMATFGAGEAARRLSGPSFAACIEDRLLGAGGLFLMWPGHAEAWLAVMQSTRGRDLVPALREAAAWLDEQQADPVHRRVQTFIRWRAPWRASFAAALGFELEGRMRSWGPDGADYGCYARIGAHG